MIDGSSASTVPRRQLGRFLREARNKAKLTVRASAVAMEWSEPKMWRIETGQNPVRGVDVEAMCRLYGVPAELTVALIALAKETKGKGWWHAYGDVVPSWFDVYIGLEESAEELRWYESELVPGQLQTAGYATSMIRSINPGIDPEEVDRRVSLRLARQALLTRKVTPLRLDVVLNEAILRRPVGGPAVMVEQLTRLLDIGELPHIRIRVVPFSAGIHRGITTGPFVLLHFPRNGDGRESEPPIVYIENPTGALYLDKPTEIQFYDSEFDLIRRAADDETGTTSRNLIATAIKEMTG